MTKFIQGVYIYDTVKKASGSEIIVPVCPLERITATSGTTTVNVPVNLSFTFQRYSLERYSLDSNSYETVQPSDSIVVTCNDQSEVLVPVDGVATTQFESAELGQFKVRARCGNAHGEAEVTVS